MNYWAIGAEVQQADSAISTVHEAKPGRSGWAPTPLPLVQRFCVLLECPTMASFQTPCTLATYKLRSDVLEKWLKHTFNDPHIAVIVSSPAP